MDVETSKMADSKLSEDDIASIDFGDLEISENWAHKEADEARDKYLSEVHVRCFYIFTAGIGKGHRCPVKVQIKNGTQLKIPPLEQCHSEAAILCSNHSNQYERAGKFSSEIVKVWDSANLIWAETLEAVSNQDRRSYQEYRGWLCKKSASSATNTAPTEAET